MDNLLLKRLRENDQDNLFEQSNSLVPYKTGLDLLDYRLGYKLVAKDMDENIIGNHDAIGVVGGSFITLIGKSGTAKTAMACKMAANIVKPYKNGLVIHFDLEGAMTLTRYRNLTNLTNKELSEHIILKSDRTYLENITDTIMAITQEKAKHKKDYTYTTEFKNEFGEKMDLYVPTVFVIDSIPQLSMKPEQKKVKAKKGSGEEDYMIDNIELGKNTYAMRVARDLTQFFKQYLSIIREYNITIISINHIHPKIQIDNPFAKSQAQVLYLKQDEQLPGGTATVYYANTIIKNVAVGSSKANIEEDGYAGFTVKSEIIKSRTNISGVSVPLVYDQNRGFSNERSLLYYAKEELGILNGGRRNSRYIGDNKDVRFDELNFVEEFKRPEVKQVLMDAVQPHLEAMLFGTTDVGEFGDNIGLTEEQFFDIIK
jgi:RecA/RadA recombinase